MVRPGFGRATTPTITASDRLDRTRALVTNGPIPRLEVVQAALDALRGHGLQCGAHSRQDVDELRAGIERRGAHAHLAIDAPHLGQPSRSASRAVRRGRRSAGVLDRADVRLSIRVDEEGRTFTRFDVAPDSAIEFEHVSDEKMLPTRIERITFMRHDERIQFTPTSGA